MKGNWGKRGAVYLHRSFLFMSMSQKFKYGGQAVIEGVMMRGRKAAFTFSTPPDWLSDSSAATVVGIVSTEMTKITASNKARYLYILASFLSL
ncbi:hypothetical protein ACFLTV_01750 [Chloroflexota bacterium]